MELLVVILALVFSISDLVGDEKVRTWERRLVSVARHQASQIRSLLRVSRIAAQQLLISVLNLLFFAFWMLQLFFRQGTLEYADQNLPLIGYWVVKLAYIWFFPVLILIVYLQLTTWPVAAAKLEGEPEAPVYRRLLSASEKALDDHEKTIEGIREGRIRANQFNTAPPLGIPIFFGALLFPAVLGFMVSRIAVVFSLSLMWVFVGMPSLVLGSIADKLGNPSYFNVGKYLVLLLALVVAIMGK